MITFSDENVYEKWDALTPEERGVLFTEKNNKLFWSLCESQNVQKEVGEDLATVVSWGLLGMISTDQVRGEIREAVSDPVAAKNLGDALVNQIIQPARAELQKNGVKAQVNLSDIRPPTPKPLGSIPVGKPNISEPSTASSAPRVTTPAIAPAIRPPQGPVVIHQEATFGPVQNAPSTLANNTRLQQKVEDFFVKKPATPPAPQFAKVQMQGSMQNAPRPTSSMQPGVETPRIVHYGELKTLLGTPPIPPQPTGGKPMPIPFSSIGTKSSQQVPMPVPQPPHAILPGVQGVPPPPRPPTSA